MKLFKFLISNVFFRNLLIAFVIPIVIICISLLALRIYTHHGQANPVPDFTGLNLEEVEQSANKAKLFFHVIDSVYQKKQEKGTVVAQNPPPGFKVKKNRTIFLTLNAFNPERIKMPKLIGISLRQAKAIIETAGLEIGKLTHIPDMTINSVLKLQFNGIDIKEGDLILKGSVIDLVLGGGLSNQVTFTPDLIALDFEKAKKKIIEASLNIGAIIFDNTNENSENSINALVWKQIPVFNKNQTIKLGSSVNIWLTLDLTKLPISDTTSVNFPAIDTIIIQTPEIDGEEISYNI